MLRKMLSNEILCKNNEYTYINETILSDVIQNSTIYLQSMKKMLGTLARYITVCLTILYTPVKSYVVKWP